jgi:methylmalonyl-CoA/ethylmalonyl-CoA epimerase
VKIHHIGIAVKSIERTIGFYLLLTNSKDIRIEDVLQDKVKVAFIQVGESLIELLEPLDPSSPVHKFLEKRGEGMHHIAIEVNDIEVKLEMLKAQGVRLIDETPRPGSEGLLVAFVHPTSCGGVLIELCERR